jgi:hypothetical protein
MTVPACSLPLQAVPGENQIGEFVRHGAPGCPAGVHGFAANPAASIARQALLRAHQAAPALRRWRPWHFEFGLLY